MEKRYLTWRESLDRARLQAFEPITFADTLADIRRQLARHSRSKLAATAIREIAAIEKLLSADAEPDYLYWPILKLGRTLGQLGVKIHARRKQKSGLPENVIDDIRRWYAEIRRKVDSNNAAYVHVADKLLKQHGIERQPQSLRKHCARN
jgi:hypothetical protein